MLAWHHVTNSEEISSPALLIYPDRVENNLRKMISLAGGSHRLRPHVKTHKLPQIIELKRYLRIDNFKVSTISEAKLTARAGGRDVLLAMQPVGPAIDQMIDLIIKHPKTQFSAVVDNPESVNRLSAAAGRAEIHFRLYVDLNVGMNRTGIRPDSGAFQLYHMIDEDPNLGAAGLHAYDGHVHSMQGENLKRAVQRTLAPVWALVSQIRAKGMTIPKLVFGGTPTSWVTAELYPNLLDGDLAESKLADRDVAGSDLPNTDLPHRDLFDNVQVSAGTSVLWDAGQLSHSPGQHFQHAAVLMTRVVSKPTDSTLCLDLGHKAVASEFPAPRVMWIDLDTSTEITHSEEHMVIETNRANEFPVGSTIYGIPYHVCPTVALHERVHVVEDNHATDTWPVIARNRFVD